jgi:hypothetical protein
MSNPAFLRRKAASDYLRETHGAPYAPSTLAKYAVVGGGPVFRRIGRVPLYSTDDLDSWVASKLTGTMRSTSDAAALSRGDRQSDSRSEDQRGGG